MAYRTSAKSNDGLIEGLRKHGIIKSDDIAGVMKKVDRGNYTLCGKGNAESYYDSPLSIGYRATISAPHMHAMCLELLAPCLKEGARVLDVGSGSGYLVACLGQMVGESGKVVGIDVIPELVSMSKENLKVDQPELLEKGIVEVKVGDGWAGDTENAPFDCIHVGAAAESLPNALMDQLKPGGRLIIPVGDEDQSLQQVDKSLDGTEFTTKVLFGVRYVPLVKNS